MSSPQFQILFFPIYLSVPPIYQIVLYLESSFYTNPGSTAMPLYVHWQLFFSYPHYVVIVPDFNSYIIDYHLLVIIQCPYFFFRTILRIIKLTIDLNPLLIVKSSDICPNALALIAVRFNIIMISPTNFSGILSLYSL